MFKKIVKGIAIGSVALTMAATAHAGQIDVNLYGASAQFKFWTAAAPDFLKFQGCADADNLSVSDGDNFDRDAGIAVCVGDVAVQGNTGLGINQDTVVIRYTTNASYDGIRAVTADASYDPDGCGPAQRLQGDLDGAELLPYSPDDDFTGGATIASLSCQDVHVGASDVAAPTFRQVSNGNLKGHAGGDYETRSVIYPDDLQDPALIGYQVDRPIVVPFGFFANNDPSTPVPFDNMTRLMATSIYNGQVLDWNEFDPGLDSLPVVVCLRHAGSGTAATLNAAVMRGDAPIVQIQVAPTDMEYLWGISPVIWFNKGSSEAITCAGENLGGVAYADVDKCGTGDNCNGGKYGWAKSMTYQGVEGNSTTIKHGQYDFWSAQWLYSDETGETDAMIDALVSFASDEINLPPSKAPYWASQGAMKWEKANDFSYPAKK